MLSFFLISRISVPFNQLKFSFVLFVLLIVTFRQSAVPNIIVSMMNHIPPALTNNPSPNRFFTLSIAWYMLIFFSVSSKRRIW